MDAKSTRNLVYWCFYALHHEVWSLKKTALNILSKVWYDYQHQQLEVNAISTTRVEGHQTDTNVMIKLLIECLMECYNDKKHSLLRYAAIETLYILITPSSSSSSLTSSSSDLSAVSTAVTDEQQNNARIKSIPMQQQFEIYKNEFKNYKQSIEIFLGMTTSMIASASVTSTINEENNADVLSILSKTKTAWREFIN